VRKTILGFALGCILSATPVPCAQEHAPTVDVCRADRAVWDNTEEETDYVKQETKHVNDGTRNKNPIANLSFREINLRLREMAMCASVDETNLDKYHDISQFYSSVVEDRYRSFIVRHHLMEQFRTEDAAGAR
jgi:hypothetical protein